MVWEHMLIYDKDTDRGVDIDIVNHKVIFDKITSEDF